MGLFQANIFKHSAIKGIKSLFSSQQRIQKCVFVSEAGVISLESMKLATGYCFDEVNKAAWAVIQKLKMPMEGSDELVLPISERDHMPLDPLNRLDDKEKKKLEALQNIAKARHAEVRSRVADEQKKNASAEMLRTLAYIVILGAFIIVAIVLLKSKKG